MPFNPPTELIVTGPYRWMRNPMVTGVFVGLFGLGLILHSAAIVFIWTPLYVVAHLIELKTIEEPELELRFGTAYTDYKHTVPMFIPRPWRRSTERTADAVSGLPRRRRKIQRLPPTGSSWASRAERMRRLKS